MDNQTTEQEEGKWTMTEEKYDLFYRGRCPDCEGLLEEDWFAAQQFYQGFEHSMCVYKCCDCGELFAEYLSENPNITDCVEYHEW